MHLSPRKSQRIGTIRFRYFNKGDYVRTPNGVAIIIKDEDPITDEESLIYSDVLVQHKEDSSNNPSNSPQSLERKMLIRITRHEFCEEDTWESRGMI